MKIFHLVTKQTHIAATTFDFRDYEDNTVLHMRIYKDSPYHDQWAALQEGDKFTLSHGVNVPVIHGQLKTIETSQPEIAANAIAGEPQLSSEVLPASQVSNIDQPKTNEDA